MRIIEEKQYSFEDVASDPDARVIVADSSKNTQELKSISELEEEAKEMVKETMASTASINVSAIKP